MHVCHDTSVTNNATSKLYAKLWTQSIQKLQAAYCQVDSRLQQVVTTKVVALAMIVAGLPYELPTALTFPF
jgi:hypothetical protein